jgi:hypothetical protein
VLATSLTLPTPVLLQSLRNDGRLGTLPICDGLVSITENIVSPLVGILKLLEEEYSVGQDHSD